MNMGSYCCCVVYRKEYKQVNSLSSLLKIVAEQSRLKILCILKQGQHCVCELMEHTQLSQSLISHHLKDLKDAGLVVAEKKEQWAYYSLTDKGKRITNVIFDLENI